ncbi:hypothetical protein FB567DRAFT_530534 [Paraphoma chrysanthemicola]|uniref:F-box domain-containing protein n=1 Tax=Paraphoma chrysanthemicola TaxID=798071 RepID=A0A8K0R0Y0_9PLEO|nr:hypothetical protein FB567DRAFT_530534 [Paraphoma chrysanthemicola]
MMFPLFSLPNELIDAIASAVDDRPTLLALAQTCSKLQPFAEAQLFKNIYIHDGPSVSRLAQSLEQPPERVRAVEHLEVTPTKHSWDGIALMPELVSRLTRLKSLKLESPMINTGRRPSWWSDVIMAEYMDLFAGNAASGVWQKGAFECLTSFTLHSHGTNDRFYNIKTILPVFLSPTLKLIHLSCIDISGATETFAEHGSESQSTRTPLETLILQRCKVPASRLDDFYAVLSRPRALRSFSVLLDTDFHQLNAQQAHAPAFIRAIQQHSDSLEYLRYMHRSINRPARGSPEHLNASLLSALSSLHQSSSGLSTFNRLHTFDVDHRSNLAELLLDKELAPQNLRTLGLTGLECDSETWQHLPAFVSAIASATPFSHLRLHTKPSGRDIKYVSMMFSLHAPTEHMYGPPQLRYMFLNLVEMLDKRSTVKLVCSRQARQLSGFHPPFLYGETLPDEAVIFDSQKLWSEEQDLDKRFDVEDYVSEEGEVAGWRGPLSGLGNSYWKE